MDAKRVHFHPAARAEYAAALDWYQARSAVAAARFADEITQAIATIAEAPHRWPKHVHGARKFPLHVFPFIVIYRERLDAIQVLAVAHGHRRPDYWKDRVP